MCMKPPRCSWAVNEAGMDVVSAESVNVLFWHIALFELLKGKFKQSKEKFLNRNGIVQFLIVIRFFISSIGTWKCLKSACINHKLGHVNRGCCLTQKQLHIPLPWIMKFLKCRVFYEPNCSCKCCIYAVSWWWLIFLYINKYNIHFRKCLVNADMCKALLALSAFLVILLLADVLFNRNVDQDFDAWGQKVSVQTKRIISKQEIAVSRSRDRNIACHFSSYECFDIYRCGGNNGKLNGN